MLFFIIWYSYKVNLLIVIVFGEYIVNKILKKKIYFIIVVYSWDDEWRRLVEIEYVK